MRSQKTALSFFVGIITVLTVYTSVMASAVAADGLIVPKDRSQLIVAPREMAEVLIANPSVADIHVHGATRVSVVGKRLGKTNLRMLDKSNNIIREYTVVVTYDLPAIRKAMRDFIPYENIGIDLVNTNIALTGEVTDAAVVDRAVKIVEEFINPTKDDDGPKVLNLLQVTSGQQVMLRVRVGEIQRSALKQLGVSLSGFNVNGNTGLQAGTGGGIAPFDTGSSIPFGGFERKDNIFAIISGSVTGGNYGLSAALEALESDGLFKVLAEPNLVALSGEKAEFLAGGEFPIPIAQSGSSDTITVEFKPFGVAVQFVPYVLSENRIRLAVQPEVSEISDADNVVVNNFVVPSVTTRRAKTTVELAPGESFMIAGLIRDQLNSTIQQIPGIAEIPVLSALFRSTEYQRSETELVIAVTPYIVDPLKNNDVRLPTDDFRPASMMESFFYGALGSLQGDVRRLSQKPSLEGPIGFMVD